MTFAAQDVYQPAVVGDGIRAQASNPEFEREGQQQTSSFIRYQLAMLEKMTEKLRAAYNGVNIHWDDLTQNMPAAPNGLRAVPHALRSSGVSRNTSSLAIGLRFGYKIIMFENLHSLRIVFASFRSGNSFILCAVQKKWRQQYRRHC